MKRISLEEQVNLLLAEVDDELLDEKAEEVVFFEREEKSDQ